MSQAELQKLIGLLNGGRTADVLIFGRKLALSHPRHPVIPNIVGLAHLSRGEPAEAAKCFSRAAELEPRFAPALCNLGISLVQLGRYDQAMASYQRAIVAKPDYPEAHFNLGNAYFQSGRYQLAARSFERALGHRPQFPDATRGLAMACLEGGDAMRAADLFRDLLSAAPTDVHLLNGLGSAEDRLGNHEIAIEHFSRVLEIEPANADAANNMGNAHMNLSRVDEAEAFFNQAIALRPADPTQHANLCGLLERTNRIDALADALGAAAAACAPGSALLSYWSGVLADRQGRREDAYRTLGAVTRAELPPALQQSLAERLAKLADRLDDTSAAWAYCAEMNEMAAARHQGHADGAGYLSEIRDLTAAWASGAPCAEAGLDEGSDLVFLVGFPRSGTTLLDSVLRGHPMVTVIEEQPLVEAMKSGLNGAATPGTLASLGLEDTAHLRALYRRALAQHDRKPGSTLTIDKMPLNLIHAGLIHHVFPKARYLLVLRHPCDCVLSCLMQNFRLNDAMANFTALETTSQMYDAAMSLWSLYAEKLPLDVATVRYEDLIADLRGTAGGVLGALGLPWDDGVLDYQTTARSRDRIRTPSYSQVTESLYGHATGRWTRYREQMAPMLPQLAPWAARWGYTL